MARVCSSSSEVATALRFDQEVRVPITRDRSAEGARSMIRRGARKAGVKVSTIKGQLYTHGGRRGS